eukprot:SAG25_NODE_10942_length_318_cov_1.415525_1_plen_59_part_01
MNATITFGELGYDSQSTRFHKLHAMQLQPLRLCLGCLVTLAELRLVTNLWVAASHGCLF